MVSGKGRMPVEGVRLTDGDEEAVMHPGKRERALPCLHVSRQERVASDVGVLWAERDILSR